MQSLNARTLAAAAGLAALSTMGLGCAVQASADPAPVYAPADGRLTLRWTIDEINDPNTCAMGGASAIDVQVINAGGTLAGEYQGRCDAFATSISPLAPGGYTANAFLIDGASRARTTPVAIDPFTIASGQELVIDIDFPASSFIP